MLKVLEGAPNEMHVLGGRLRYRGEGVMLGAEDGHVGMDFVGNDEDMVAGTDVGHTLQRGERPHHTARVVGIAEYQYLALRVDNRLEVVEVHLVVGAVHALSQSLGHGHKGSIDGSLYDDFVAGVAEYVHGQADAFDNAGNVR